MSTLNDIISDIIIEYGHQAVEVEIYEANCSAYYWRGIHTDNIKYLGETCPNADWITPLSWSLMDAEEYNGTVFVNTSTEFLDVFEPGDKVLVVVLPMEWREVAEYWEGEGWYEHSSTGSGISWRTYYDEFGTFVMDLSDRINRAEEFDVPYVEFLGNDD